MLLRLIAASLLLGPAAAVNELVAQTSSGHEAAQESPRHEIDMRLRFRWDAPQSRPWQARVAIGSDSPASPSDEATLSEFKNGYSDSATAAARITSGGQRLDCDFPDHQKQGMIEFRVRGRSETILTLGLDSGEDHSSSAVLLRDLLAGEPVRGSGRTEQDTEQQWEWSIERVGGDSLLIEFPETGNVWTEQDDMTVTVSGNSMVALAGRKLQLHYALYRLGVGKVVDEKRYPFAVDADGNTEPIKVVPARPKDPGVYEFRCSVETADENIWTRLRRKEAPLIHHGRPLVVVSPQLDTATPLAPWKTIGTVSPRHEGSSVSQWLPPGTDRLIPGSAIASTLPADSHSGKPISLIGPGGQYRAALPVALPGYPHRLTLRYPSGRATRLRVELSRVGDTANPDLDFVISAPPQARPSEPWSTQSFVYYPRRGDEIRLTNLDGDAPVAFESIRVEAGPRRLADKRRAASSNRTVAYQMGRFDWVDKLARDTLSQESVASCQPETITLYQLWVATGRLRDHAMSAGMNALIVPVIDGGRAWYPSKLLDPFRDDRRFADDGLSLFLTMMDRAGLAVHLSVDTAAPLRNLERTTGLDTPSFEPEEPSARRKPVALRGRYNSLDPQVASALAELLSEVHRVAEGHECYSGLVLRMDQRTRFGQISGESTDDLSLSLFASSLPADSVPKSELRRWVESAGKPAYQEWLRTRRVDLFSQLAGAAPQKSVWVQADGRGVDEESVSVVVKRQAAKLEVMRDVCRAPVGTLTDRIRHQQSMPLGENVGRPRKKVVRIRDRMTLAETEVPVIRNETQVDLARVIDRYDPEVIILSAMGITGGMSEPITETLSAFSALPTEEMVAVASVDSANGVVGVRLAGGESESWMTVCNRAPWPMQVEVLTTPPQPWAIVGRATADASGTAGDNRSPTLSQDGQRTLLQIPPTSLTILRSSQPNAVMKTWTSRVSGEAAALDGIKKDVSAIVTRMGVLSDLRIYPVLSNGGFEQSGGVGLVGWLHAQHPPDAVQVDAQESVEGSRSVRLTTDARSSSRTWLVSETFLPPESGRLAVSLACRGELSGGDSLHRLKVSIEGTKGGQPLRRSTEFELPRDGKWQRHEIVLELDGVQAPAVESLRLTIDSLSAGRVWIDDVRLHDWFPLAKERGDLQSQAFLAVQGLQKGNLTASARLLQNHWAKVLLGEAATRQLPAVIDTTETPQESPGVAERIRGWLPRPLRF